MLINKKTFSEGFSLVELLIAIFVFVIVVTITSSIFIDIVKQQRRTLARQELLNQASYITEYMSRALRMAVRDDIGDCLAAGENYEIIYSGTGIRFKNHSNGDICQEFYFDSDSGLLKEKKTSGSNVTNNALTAGNILLSRLNFSLAGDTLADTFQPRVALSFEAYYKKDNQIKGQIQTTISQRNLDAQ